MLDPRILGLAASALGSLGLAIWCFRPEQLPELEDDFAVPVAPPEPEPLLSKLRGSRALEANAFPRQHSRPCVCNARALVWLKDRYRHDAWMGFCRRCGLERFDVVAGVVLDLR